MHPTPNASDAIRYVQDHFASYPTDERPTVCGTIAPGRDSTGVLEGTRDVLFVIPGDPTPARFTVWREGADGALYGEW